MMDLSVRPLTQRELKFLAQVRRASAQRDYPFALASHVQTMLVDDFEDIPLATRLMLHHLQTRSPYINYDPMAVFWWSSFIGSPEGVWGWSEILLRMSRKQGVVALLELIQRWDAGVPRDHTVASNYAIRM